MTVADLAKALFTDALPSRNKAFERYKDAEFLEAVRIVKSARHLLEELSELSAGEVDAKWRGERLEVRYRFRDVERTVVLDEVRLALIEDEPIFKRAIAM